MDFYESTVQDVISDFEKRKKQRRHKELIWQLNLNFLNGKQHCQISQNDNIENNSPKFFWQRRESFNHIAPIMEARSSKLLRLRPKIKVNPFDQSATDKSTAKICESLVNSLFERVDMKSLISEATAWSEATGSGFYKLTWNANKPCIEPSGNSFLKRNADNSHSDTSADNNPSDTTANNNLSDTSINKSFSPTNADKGYSSKAVSKGDYDNSSHVDEGTDNLNLNAESNQNGFTNPSFDDKNSNAIMQILSEFSRKKGDIDISVCSPFEIYPDNLSANDIQDCASIIHARAISVDDIKAIWNADVLPENIPFFSTATAEATPVENCAVVIERYSKPSAEHPKGRLTIVAGNALLHDGPLPYSANGAYFFPFIRQASIPVAGSFFGTSIIERLIPLQRAYNNVKNKKHELLNRLAAGIIAVEEGSVNVDELEDDGLYPGKILVYRQGAPIPEFIQSDRLPVDFANEEERILEEFTVISGVSDFMRSSNSYKASSGTAINLLLEQDDSRMAISSEQINSAIRKAAYMALYLYHSFIHPEKLLALCNESPENAVIFLSQSISAENISIITENENNTAPSSLKTLAIELYSNGLLDDSNGKLSEETKRKLLELLGLNQLI